MREGWADEKLGSLCDFVRGPFGGSLKKSCFVDKGFAVYEQQHAINNQFHQIRYHVDEVKFAEMQRFELQAGDLIMSCSGTMGKVAIVPKGIKRGIINQALLKLTPSNNLNVEYLKYWMESNGFQESLGKHAKGVAIKNVASVKVLKQIEIPLPPLSEQKQIVVILDKAFAAIDKAKANIERNIENAKELFQSKLNEIFSQPARPVGGKGEGWEEKKLGELGKVSMCKRILKKQTSSTGDIPFYKIGTFGKTPNAFIDKGIYQEYKKKYSFPKKGDILISASGTIGRRVIYDGEPAYFQDSNIVWIDNNQELVLNEYLYQFYGICNWNPSKGATISRLYNDDLRRIKISFPNTIEQNNLVRKMVKLNTQTQGIIFHYQKKLDGLRELKKSILQKAFTGELTEKDILV